MIGCGREQSRHDPRYYSRIYLKGLRISRKTARITDFPDMKLECCLLHHSVWDH
jgi:hypothetical protein